MRIAMFMPSLGPAALGWKVHLDFADAVRRLGHDFDLLTTPPPRATNPQEVENKAEAGSAPDAVARVLPVPAAWRRMATAGRPLFRTRQLLPAAGALAAYLREHGDSIDLLHLEVAYPHAAAAGIAAKMTGWGGPTAVTPMGEDVLVVPDRAYGLRRYAAPRWLVRRTLRRATMLRCLSPLFERHIAAIAPHTPRRVIPLNISAEAAAVARMSGNERSEWRREARTKLDAEFDTAGRPLVLSLGRLHPFKGVDLLIDAAADFADATVLIVGPSLSARPFGDMKAALESHAAYRGVADKVRLVGRIHPSRALETLAAADVVAVPSPLESLNKVCMEAAAVGTPFVVTETTGISAWVPDGGVGLVIPPRNTAALTWAIDEVIGGHFPADAARMSEFAGQFAPDRIAGEVLAFYEESLGAESQIRCTSTVFPAGGAGT